MCSSTFLNLSTRGKSLQVITILLYSLTNEAIASSSISTTSLPSCSTIQKSALELLSSDATITSPSSSLLPRSSNWKCSLEDSCTDCPLKSALHDDGPLVSK